MRDDVTIQVVIPFGVPIPPSPSTSEAILAGFAERGIEFVPDRRVASLDRGHERGGARRRRRGCRYDLFLGVPVHRAPAVVEASGLTEDGWIPVDPRTLATRFPGRVRGGRRDERGHAEGRRVRRAAGERGGRPVDRADPRARPRPPATTAPARATSSSAATRSRASTWTSTRRRASRPARSSRLRRRRPRRRRGSRRSVGPDGSGDYQPPSARRSWCSASPRSNTSSFRSVNASRNHWESSRPTPLSPVPPNGASWSQ